MIQIENINYQYKNAKDPTLKNLNLSLEPGKVTVVMGPSGCGKSTLLRVLMGIETGATGFIKFSNYQKELKLWTPQQNLFSLVPQVPHLFPWKTVFENVYIACPATLSPDVRKTNALSALQLVQLESHITKYPSEISQGMASRVALARTLVMEAPVILFDEPFASLDAHTRRHLQAWLLKTVSEKQIPALFVTHDLHEGIQLGTDIYVLSKSPATVVKHVTIDENKKNTQSWVKSDEYFEIVESLKSALDAHIP